MRRNHYLALLLAVFLLVSLVKVPAIPVTYSASEHGSAGTHGTAAPEGSHGGTESADDVGPVAVKVGSGESTATTESSDGIGPTASRAVVVERVNVTEAVAVGRNGVFGWALAGELSIENPTDEPMAYTITTTVRDEGRVLGRGSKTVEVVAGGDHRVVVEIGAVPYRSNWPRAYEVTYTIAAEGDVLTERAPFPRYRQTMTVWEYLTG